MFSLFYCLHAKVQMHLGVVTILISSVFRSAALDRGEALIRGKRIFRCEYPKMLIRGRCILEEIRYFPQQKIKRTDVWFQISNFC